MSVILLLVVLSIMASGNRSNNCINKYVTELSSINSQYHDIFLDSLTELSERYKKTDSIISKNPSSKLIINIGPGSSGTRSLYLAATQLNITSFHLGASSINCSSYSHHQQVSFGPLFNIRTMKILSSSHTAFWGDIPAPNYWWNILHRFSEGILYIMTDIDDNRWLTSRRAMCSKKSPTW